MGWRSYCSKGLFDLFFDKTFIDLVLARLKLVCALDVLVKIKPSLTCNKYIYFDVFSVFDLSKSKTNFDNYLIWVKPIETWYRNLSSVNHFTKIWRFLDPLLGNLENKLESNNLRNDER